MSSSEDWSKRMNDPWRRYRLQPFFASSRVEMVVSMYRIPPAVDVLSVSHSSVHTHTHPAVLSRAGRFITEHGSCDRRSNDTLRYTISGCD